MKLEILDFPKWMKMINKQCDKLREGFEQVMFEEERKIEKVMKECQ